MNPSAKETEINIFLVSAGHTVHPIDKLQIQRETLSQKFKVESNRESHLMVTFGLHISIHKMNTSI